MQYVEYNLVDINYPFIVAQYSLNIEDWHWSMLE